MTLNAKLDWGLVSVKPFQSLEFFCHVPLTITV